MTPYRTMSIDAHFSAVIPTPTRFPCSMFNVPYNFIPYTGIRFDDGVVSGPSFASVRFRNVKNFVTTILGSVENFLSWHTQFTTFLVMNELLSFFDDRHPPLLQLFLILLVTLFQILITLFVLDMINVLGLGYLLRFQRKL